MTSSYDIPESPFVDHLLDLVESDKWGELQLEGMEYTARELDRDGAHAAGAKASSLWTLPPTQELVTCAAPFPIRLISVYNWTGVDFQLTFDGGEQVTVRAGKTFPFVPPHGTQRVRVQSLATGTGFFGLWAFRKLPDAPFPGFDIGSGGSSSATDVAIHDNATPAQHLAVDVNGRIGVNNFPAAFNVGNLPATQPVSAAAGAFVDGSQATMGTLADAAYVSGSGSVVSVLKGVFGRLANVVSLAFNAASGLIVDTRAAANLASGQVATSTTAGTLVAARATRQSVLIRNLDATITVYVGPATVTAANGMPIKAGESLVLNNTALVQVIAASGTPTVAYVEEYS